MVAIQLFLADAGEAGPTVARKAAEWFDERERERQSRLRFPADRDLHLAAHVLLREVLARYTGTPAADLAFTAGEHGKPVLEAAPELAFSLAHAGGVALLGVSLQADLGVDVEPVDARRDALAIARRFHPGEQKWLQAADPTERAARFAELWTLKESVAKATGHGLQLPLETFSCRPGPDGTLDTTLPGEDPRRWHLRVAAHQGLRVAFAARTAVPLQTVTATAHRVDLADGALHVCELRTVAATASLRE
jgi:4'-phosphopantetheinyl transferase